MAICDSHKLDLICGGCVKAWIARHDKMEDFIKKIAFDDNEFKGEYPITWKAEELLREIGLIII